MTHQLSGAYIAQAATAKGYSWDTPTMVGWWDTINKGWLVGYLNKGWLMGYHQQRLLVGYHQPVREPLTFRTEHPLYSSMIL